MLNLFNSPLFAVDQLLAFLPLVLRVILWAVLAGLLAILTYKLVSNQEKVKQLKFKAKELRPQLLSDEIDFEQYQALAKETLLTSMKLIATVIVPTLLSALPILIIADMIYAFYKTDLLYHTSFDWLNTWELTFFLGVFSSALGFKIFLKIE